MDPVLLCNELGAEGLGAQTGSSSVQNSDRSSMSVKEAVQIARNNNFMGLMCSWRLLVSQSSTCTGLAYFPKELTHNKKKKLAPALIEAIKTAGLVLISDQSGSNEDTIPTGFPLLHGGPDGVDGTLRRNAILHFNDSVDM